MEALAWVPCYEQDLKRELSSSYSISGMEPLDRLPSFVLAQPMQIPHQNHDSSTQLRAPTWET